MLEQTTTTTTLDNQNEKGLLNLLFDDVTIAETGS